MALQKMHIHFSRKEDIEKALDDMLAFTENMESFKKCINSDNDFQWIFYPLDDAPLFTIEEEGFPRYIYFKDVGVNVYEDTYYFTKQVVTFGLQEKLDKVICNVVNFYKEWYTVWSSPENILCSDFSALMALFDKGYVPRYTWFIKQMNHTDIDHETLQIEATEALFDKHGYCDETISHLVAAVSKTQAGNETFYIQSEKAGFAKYLKDNNRLGWLRKQIIGTGAFEGFEEQLDYIFQQIEARF